MTYLIAGVIGCEHGQVRAYGDKRSLGKRIITLPAHEFIGRFLHHILPQPSRSQEAKPS
jgi:hypothetical protein